MMIAYNLGCFIRFLENGLQMRQVFAQIFGTELGSQLPDVVLAPMSGITDRPFRRAVRRAGGGLVVSEMIASHAVLTEVKSELQKLRFSAEEEAPLSIQLAGWDPEIMAEAARIAEQLGASMIDINMGCPAKKVTGRMSGSALMAEPERAEQICAAVVDAVSCPVSLKTRLGVDDGHLNAADIARRAEAAGISLLTVHGRTRAQMYKGSARWHLVSDVVSAVSIPVLVNGDITSTQTAQTAQELSGAAGVMVGRAAQGRPWLLAEIAAGLEAAASGQPSDFQPPDHNQKHQIIITHLDEMFSHYGRSGVRLARKHMASYCEGLAGGQHLKPELMSADEPEQIFSALNRFFRHAQQDAA